MDAKVSLLQPLCPNRGSERNRVGQGAPALAGEPCGTTISGLDLTAPSLPPESDFEIVASGEVNIEDWLEMQLLDCQNLARQQGMASLASVLDMALELLNSSDGANAEARVGGFLAYPREGTVVPFRAARGS